MVTSSAEKLNQVHTWRSLQTFKKYVLNENAIITYQKDHIMRAKQCRNTSKIFFLNEHQIIFPVWEHAGFGKVTGAEVSVSDAKYTWVLFSDTNLFLSLIR